MKWFFNIFLLLLLIPISTFGQTANSSQLRTSFLFAKDTNGLRLFDVNGIAKGNGLFVRNGGYVSVGDTLSERRFNIDYGHMKFSFLSPAASDSVTVAVGDSTTYKPSNKIGQGTYKYKITYTTPEGETLAGTATNGLAVADSVKNPYISVTKVPTYKGRGGIVTGRKIYRTLKDGSVYYLAKTISNNTTTSFMDSLGDNSICSNATAPTLNTTAGGIYGGSTLVAAVQSDGWFRFPVGFGSKATLDSTNADVTLTAYDSGKTITNKKFSAKHSRTLPAAADGLEFDFVASDTDTLQILLNGDTIWDANAFTAVGMATGSKVSTLKLYADTDSTWVVKYKTGTWVRY